MNSEILFGIALGLILEPIIVTSCLRIRAAFMLSLPFDQASINRVTNYWRDVNDPYRFGIMAPFRKRVRRCLQSAGVLVLIGLLTNDIFNLNLL